MKTTISIISRTVHEVERVATIPTQPRKTYTLSDVRVGLREYRVRDYGRDDVSVVAACDPRQRPVRRCGLRDRIVAAARA